MSNTAADLRQRALECEHKATLVKDEAARQRFLELARHWSELASDYEELHRVSRKDAPLTPF
jgi:hypothetical protein